MTDIYCLLGEVLITLFIVEFDLLTLIDIIPPSILFRILIDLSTSSLGVSNAGLSPLEESSLELPPLELLPFDELPFDELFLLDELFLEDLLSEELFLLSDLSFDLLVSSCAL